MSLDESLYALIFYLCIRRDSLAISYRGAINL